MSACSHLWRRIIGFAGQLSSTVALPSCCCCRRCPFSCHSRVCEEMVSSPPPPPRVGNVDAQDLHFPFLFDTPQQQPSLRSVSSLISASLKSRALPAFILYLFRPPPPFPQLHHTMVQCWYAPFSSLAADLPSLQAKLSLYSPRFFFYCSDRETGWGEAKRTTSAFFCSARSLSLASFLATTNNLGSRHRAPGAGIIPSPPREARPAPRAPCFPPPVLDGNTPPGAGSRSGDVRGRARFRLQQHLKAACCKERGGSGCCCCCHTDCSARRASNDASPASRSRSISCSSSSCKNLLPVLTCIQPQAHLHVEALSSRP